FSFFFVIYHIYLSIIRHLPFLCLIFYLNRTIIRDLSFLCLIYYLNRTIIRDLPLLCLIYYLNRTIIRGLTLLCLIYQDATYLYTIVSTVCIALTLTNFFGGIYLLGYCELGGWRFVLRYLGSIRYYLLCYICIA